MAASGDDLVEDVVEDICFDVVAVLPAGGCGVRMNLEIPKQVYNRFIPKRMFLAENLASGHIVEHSDTYIITVYLWKSALVNLKSLFINLYKVIGKKETSTCKLISSVENKSLYSHRCTSAVNISLCRMKTKVVFSSKAILRDISRVSVNNDQIQELITLANICQMSLEYSYLFQVWNIPCEILNLSLVRKDIWELWLPWVGREGNRGIPENKYESVGQKS